jgi:hypothetical protein
MQCAGTQMWSSASPAKARPSAEGEPHSSVGAALLRAGVPAVIAKQYELAEDAAGELARVFYAELAAGTPVDLALAEARQHLCGRYRSRLDWAVPVLFLRSDDGTSFEVAEPADAPVEVVLSDVGMPPLDSYAPYENGLRHLLRRLEPGSNAYDEALFSSGWPKMSRRSAGRAKPAHCYQRGR